MKHCKTAADGARRITFLLGRLTVLRSMLRTEPAAKLMELCEAMAAGDAAASAARYHAMTAALLENPNRRVTGDIFKDFLFAEVLESSNRFARLCAAHRTDPPVMLAMEQDLRMVQELFGLECGTLIDWIGSITRRADPIAPPPARRPSAEERITGMASTAWGGGFFQKDRARSRVPEPEATAPLPDELELSSWVRWEYDDPGERVTYEADDGLAVIYRQFLAAEDWGALVEPLAGFHREYGSGEFLHYRAFVATDDGLQGVELDSFPSWDDIVVSHNQKERLYANTLRFLHTGRGENALLYGAGGMGKSSLVLALAKELPELRFVFLAQRDFSDCMATLAGLSEQPFRFLAFLDDLSLSEREYRRLKAAVKSRLYGGNSLLYATADQRPRDSSVFGLELGFEMLPAPDFARAVQKELDRANAAVDPNAVQEACRRWEAERGELSLRAAGRLAEALLRDANR